MHTARLLTFCACSALLLSCGTEEGDEFVLGGPPPPAGKDRRIHEIRDPASPFKAKHDDSVAVSGAVVIAVDTYDETSNGKSTGTIYVQDLGSKEPYSGISLYSPSFIPGNLRVGPGDALDLRGSYQENQDIPIKFAPGAFLVQLANPIGTFRYDATEPPPVEIDVKELSTYETGRKWLNMLVTVKNITLPEDVFGSSGRQGVRMMPKFDTEVTGCDSAFPKAPTLVNELTDLTPAALAKDKVVKSVTGVVTYFCNLHLAPRSAKDIVQ